MAIQTETSKLQNSNIAKVLKELGDVLYNHAAFCDHSGGMAYCNHCESFTLVSDSYSRHVGRDMSREKGREQCVWCDGIEFIPASYYDLLRLRAIYGPKAPSKIIQGIEKTLNKLQHHTTLTENFSLWEKLRCSEQVRQIKKLFIKQEELANVKEELTMTQTRIESLEASL